MRFIRFRHHSAVEMRGVVDDGTVYRIHGSFFQNFTLTQETYPFHEIIPLPPVLPQTMAFCGGGIRSYVKSPASLAAGGRLPYPAPGVLYCVPRIAFVIRKTNLAEIFGAAPMLDFISAPDIAGLADSGAAYTMIGPSVRQPYRWQDITPVLAVNGETFPLPLNPEAIGQEIDRALPLVPFITGDIIAVGIGESRPCERGVIIEIRFDETEVLSCRII